MTDDEFNRFLYESALSRRRRERRRHWLVLLASVAAATIAIAILALFVAP